MNTERMADKLADLIFGMRTPRSPEQTGAGNHLVAFRFAPDRDISMVGRLPVNEEAAPSAGNTEDGTAAQSATKDTAIITDETEESQGV